jgi:hypothetical protein
MHVKNTLCLKNVCGHCWCTLNGLAGRAMDDRRPLQDSGFCKTRDSQPSGQTIASLCRCYSFFFSALYWFGETSSLSYNVLTILMLYHSSTEYPRLGLAWLCTIGYSAFILNRVLLHNQHERTRDAITSIMSPFVPYFLVYVQNMYFRAISWLMLPFRSSWYACNRDQYKVIVRVCTCYLTCSDCSRFETRGSRLIVGKIKFPHDTPCIVSLKGPPVFIQTSIPTAAMQYEGFPFAYMICVFRVKVISW